MATKMRGLLRRLASPEDRELLERDPSVSTRLRVMGRIGLRYWYAYLAILMFLSLGAVSSGMDVYHRTEQPQFCGACHEMSHNFNTWNQSHHKNISCTDCHAQEGVVGWMKTKAAGLNQLRVHFTAQSISGIKVEGQQRAIITENCRRCHAGLARVGERLGLGVSHRQHLERGLDCITCHTGSFTHPKTNQVSQTGAAAPKTEKEVLESRFVDVKQCYGCHDGKTVQGGKIAFSAKDETKCMKCHPDAEQALAHGGRHASAAKRRPCLDCHDEPTKEPHFKVADVSAICKKCHAKEEHASAHFPYSHDTCGDCHRVMSPVYLFKTLPRPTNAMCLGCHEPIAKAIASKDPKDIGAFANPKQDLHALHAAKLDKDKVDWCLDCHQPHGSPAKRALLLLRPAGTAQLTETGGRCQGGCHQKEKVSYLGPD